MKACLQKMEACLKSKETTLEEMANAAAQPEVPNEEAAVVTIGAMKDRYGDRHLAIGRRRELQKRTQGDGGPRKKLVAACRRMTRRVIPAPRKGTLSSGTRQGRCCMRNP
jgi:hypothetical protein